MFRRSEWERIVNDVLMVAKCLHRGSRSTLKCFSVLPCSSAKCPASLSTLLLIFFLFHLNRFCILWINGTQIYLLFDFVSEFRQAWDKHKNPNRIVFVCARFCWLRACGLGCSAEPSRKRMVDSNAAKNAAYGSTEAKRNRQILWKV